MRFPVLLLLLAPWAAALKLNPRFFGFSTYLGPIVNLSYSDRSVLRVARTLRIGSLRYPGGSTANSWNLSAGRWVPGHGDWAAGPTAAAGSYANNTALLPEGTFTPKAFMDGIGSTLQAPPIWNLNLVSLRDPPSQLDALKEMAVPVEMVELGNEDADQGGKPRGQGDPSSYLRSAVPVVARTRALFPGATISVIGCFGDPWAPCAVQLKAAFEGSPRLFDAVTIHQYSPSNATIIARGKSDGTRRAATLMSIPPSLRQLEHKVSSTISPHAPIWLDEFNWGGDWGNVTWPGEGHGALRGLVWATYVLSAMQITADAQAAGRSGFESLDYYSLFFQPNNSWSRWASCAFVPNAADTPGEVRFDGVAQIFAHVTSVVWRHKNVTLIPSVAEQSGDCLLGARFSSLGGPTPTDTLVLNMCDEPQPLPSSVAAEASSWHFYSGFDNAGWVAADNIRSLDTPPWENGPLTVHSRPFGPGATVPAISLSIFEAK
eukprot:COSAG02_NODE_11494_length_1714_cov_0.957895_1_plen_489_part_00